MKENPFRENREELNELLGRYENLKNGRKNSFIEEEAFEKILEHFLEKEDLTRASEAADFAIEQYPYSAMLLLKKADILLSSRNYKKALAALEKAEMLDSSDINLYILKTDVYLALDQQEKAVLLLQDALKLFEGEERIELLFELADVYDDYEEFDKVFDCLKMILEQERNNEEALYKICFWTDFTGRNEESIRIHHSIIDEYPYNELAWFNLGAAYQGLKLYEKAIDAYQYAIAIDEKLDYAYRNIGDAYIRLRKYKEAIEALEKVNELAKPEDVIYEAIGHCYEKLKNYAQARFHYRKASHMRQDDSKIFYKIACTYFFENQWENAAKQLEHALKINRSQAEYNMLMGECKLKLNRFKEATIFFLSAVHSRPKNTNYREALIRCLYFGGFYSEGLTQLQQAQKIVGDKPVFYYYRTAILLATGKTKEAVIVLEIALKRAAKLLKKLVELNPAILQNQQIVAVLSKYKMK